MVSSMYLDKVSSMYLDKVSVVMIIESCRDVKLGAVGRQPMILFSFYHVK